MTMNIMEIYCLKYSFCSFCMITSKDSDFLVGLIIPKYNTINSSLIFPVPKRPWQ